MPAPDLDCFQVREKAVPGTQKGSSAWGVGVVGLPAGSWALRDRLIWDGVFSRPPALMGLFSQAAGGCYRATAALCLPNSSYFRFQTEDVEGSWGISPGTLNPRTTQAITQPTPSVRGPLIHPPSAAS